MEALVCPLLFPWLILNVGVVWKIGLNLKMVLFSNVGGLGFMPGLALNVPNWL